MRKMYNPKMPRSKREEGAYFRPSAVLSHKHPRLARCQQQGFAFLQAHFMELLRGHLRLNDVVAASGGAVQGQ